jgi:hypothetical protein
MSQIEPTPLQEYAAIKSLIARGRLSFYGRLRELPPLRWLPSPSPRPELVELRRRAIEYLQRLPIVPPQEKQNYANGAQARLEFTAMEAFTPEACAATFCEGICNESRLRHFGNLVLELCEEEHDYFRGYVLCRVAPEVFVVYHKLYHAGSDR